MYSLAIFLYAFFVRLVAPYNRKAGQLVEGHKHIFDTLEREIDPMQKYIWIHAASLGEFEQGRPIIEEIKNKYPQYKILLTFFSPSGYEVRKNYHLADVITYLPFDKKKNVRRFLDLARPSKVIFIKYEFWLNFINQLYTRHIPVYMVSAIFRPSQLFFKKIGRPYRSILRKYEMICVQDENSKQLLASIEIEKNVKVCGDTRFDRVLEISKTAKLLPIFERFTQERDGNRIETLVAGSSWPKDEEIFTEYFNQHPEIKLIIAPHEIEESHLLKIESLLRRPFTRLSGVTVNNAHEFDCLIVDSFGLLSSIYRYGEVAYVGGGFGVGIHNVLEAAVYDMPVIFGPNFKKFREACELIDYGGAFCIEEEDSFVGLMQKFNNQEFLVQSGQAAGKYVQNNSNVVEKIMKILQL